MTIQKDQVTKLLEALEHIRKRPSMYMTDDLPTIVNFLMGFSVACGLFGISIDYDFVTRDGIDVAVLRERGWETSGSGHPAHEMRERGMDEDAITEELLTIAIEVVKRRYLSEDMD